MKIYLTSLESFQDVPETLTSGFCCFLDVFREKRSLMSLFSLEFYRKSNTYSVISSSDLLPLNKIFFLCVNKTQLNQSVFPREPIDQIATRIGNCKLVKFRRMWRIKAEPLREFQKYLFHICSK